MEATVTMFLAMQDMIAEQEHAPPAYRIAVKNAPLQPQDQHQHRIHVFLTEVFAAIPLALREKIAEQEHVAIFCRIVVKNVPLPPLLPAAGQVMTVAQLPQNAKPGMSVLKVYVYLNLQTPPPLPPLLQTTPARQMMAAAHAILHIQIVIQ